MKLRDQCLFRLKWEMIVLHHLVTRYMPLLNEMNYLKNSWTQRRPHASRRELSKATFKFECWLGENCGEIPRTTM